MSAEDVRKLHSKFFIYQQCDHDENEDARERHDGRTVIYIEDLGYTCAEPSQTVCFECDTDDGEVREDTEYGVWPCATLMALDK